MGRTLKNELQIHSISCLKNRKTELYQVKIPLHTKVTFKEVVSENKKINKKWYGTGSEIYPKPITEKEIEGLKSDKKRISELERNMANITEHLERLKKEE